MAAQMNPFAGGQAGGGAGGGYTGWGGIAQFLQGGINQSQMTNLTNGATGGDGMAVGGAHGAFAGLSPYAVHFLATSGLLDKVPTQQASMVDANGAPLTGSALAMAHAQQMMYDQAPGQFKLGSDVTGEQLASLFGGGVGGHPSYAHGFGPGGAVGGGQFTPGGGHPGGPPQGPGGNGGGPIVPGRQHGGDGILVQRPGGGPGAGHGFGPGPVVGRGVDGHAFHNLAAYHASLAYAKARLNGRQGPPMQGGNPPRRSR